MSWEDLLTEDEQIFVMEIREEIAAARDELVKAKTKFDRLCDDLYLFGKRVRDEQRGADF
jgi:hypothetical protein